MTARAAIGHYPDEEERQRYEEDPDTIIDRIIDRIIGGDDGTDDR